MNAPSQTALQVPSQTASAEQQSSLAQVAGRRSLIEHAPRGQCERELGVLDIAPSAVADRLPTATPEKRKRGKCMSRRSQVGSIETSGKWYVIRFWKDLPGQDERIHASERICTISGPGSL